MHFPAGSARQVSHDSRQLRSFSFQQKINPLPARGTNVGCYTIPFDERGNNRNGQKVDFIHDKKATGISNVVLFEGLIKTKFLVEKLNQGQPLASQDTHTMIIREHDIKEGSLVLISTNSHTATKIN